jgi:hypothetical protein
LLLVKGSVPGANGSLVFVRNAVKGPAVGPYEPRAKQVEPEHAEPEEQVSPDAASDAVEEEAPA